MRWWHVQFEVLHEGAEAVSALLQDFPDVQGVQLEGLGALQVPHPEYGEWFDQFIEATDHVDVSVYFPENQAKDELSRRIAEVIAKVEASGLNVGNAMSTLAIELVDDSAWLNVWKENYDPIPVGDKLVIVPSWSKDEIPEMLKDRLPIIVEPGMAFGTGTHQTTQMCTSALADLDLSDKAVLDVGTGTGVLAIAAARLGASHVTAIDIDPVAVQAATENVSMNGLTDPITVLEGNLLTGFQADAKFDVVIANILRDVVILLLPQVATRMASGGYLISSGYIDTQAPLVEEALQKHGFSIAHRYQKDDWMATLAVKN